MSLLLTLGLLVGAVALTAVFGWLGARAPDLVRGPRLLPYRFLMLMSATASILLLVHMANLAGVHTGARY